MRKNIITIHSFLCFLFFSLGVLGQNYSGGAGTLANPYLISTKADLKYLSENTTEWSKHFAQNSNIVFSTSDFNPGGDFYNAGNGFIPIGDGNSGNYFTGSYDGNDYSISNLFINRPNQTDVGFFGAIDATTVHGINLINVQISGDISVGGMIGSAYDSYVYQCSSTGTVNGNNLVGGLIGYIQKAGPNYSFVSVENCYSACAIAGDYNCGGLIGHIDGSTVRNSYSIGNVANGISDIGGLIGGINPPITFVNNCFWDNQTSGTTVSAAGIGKTTVQMKTQSTFTSATWDFISESTNGTNDIWQMSLLCPNNGYPIFSWQNTSNPPSQPSSITGLTEVCSGQAVTYNVVNDPAATSYSWTLPAGWLGNSTGNSINVTSGSGSGTISVVSNNSCGTSIAQTLTVISNSTPSQPTSISGNPVVCPGQAVTYNVTNDPAATSYSWSVPGGWSILPPSNTNAVTLAVGGSTGVISVTANNSCGSSTAQTFNVVVSTPPVQPSTVVGNTTVCSGTLNTYSVTNDANAQSYTWTLPSGWSGSSTTNSIAATAGTTGGNVSVVANYFCGTSAPSIISVNVNVPPAQPSAINGLTAFCEDNLSQNYSVTDDANANSYTWSLPSGWSGSSTSNSIITTATSNGGTISVYASNSCGNSPAQSATIVVNPLPTVNYVQNPSLVCINYAPFELSSATPAGGNYSGFGVNGTTFDPTAAGIGNHLISYFYTDANGCSSMTSDIITVDDCAGIEETEVEVIRVFPNPTNGLVTVQSDNEEIESITLINSCGSVLSAVVVQNSTYSLDLSGLSSGVYYLICKIHSTPVHRQIIVQ